MLRDTSPDPLHSEKNCQREQAKSSATTLIIAGTASAVWLGVAFAAGWFAEPCSDQYPGTFACLKANEWGDYLAGVFAPLAFFWLVATVWIQSNELREQRRELVQNRQEIELNREVMKAQADEARRQAEFIGEQTEALRKNEQDGAFRVKLSVLRQWTLDECKDLKWTTNTNYRAAQTDFGYLTTDMPEEPVEFMVQLVARLSRAHFDGLSGSGEKWEKLISLGADRLEELVARLERAIQMRKSLSPAMQEVIDESAAEYIVREVNAEFAKVFNNPKHSGSS